MKCLPTHQTASCFKFYPSGKFKAPMNNPLHKQSSSVHFAKFTNLVIIAARRNSKLLKITSAERTSYSACSQVSITDAVVNTMRSTSIGHAMFQNTSKANPLFSNIFFVKYFSFPQNICPIVFYTFWRKHSRRLHEICKLILMECHFCWLNSIQSHRYFGGQRLNRRGCVSVRMFLICLTKVSKRHQETNLDVLR